MAVTIKSAREIEYMREAGRLLAEVHEELGAFIRPGISTLDIDMLGEKLIRSRGCNRQRAYSQPLISRSVSAGSHTHSAAAY